MYNVTLTEVIEKMEMKNLLPDIDTDSIKITTPAVNRMALQLVGFYEHFDAKRIQIIGNVELAYMKKQPDEVILPIYDRIFQNKIPCIVFCWGLQPCDRLMNVAEQHGVPVLVSELRTSEFIAKAVRWLSEQLAPRISIHGVLVDV